MRALTNDHKDCKLIKVDPDDPTSPYGVMQEGYDSNDPRYRMRMFYLQRDGQWIDEIARSARPDSEASLKLPRKRSRCSAVLPASQSSATCPSHRTT